MFSARLNYNENTYFPIFTPTASPRPFLWSQDIWSIEGTHLQCSSGWDGGLLALLGVLESTPPQALSALRGVS